MLRRLPTSRIAATTGALLAHKSAKKAASKPKPAAPPPPPATELARDPLEELPPAPSAEVEEAREAAAENGTDVPPALPTPPAPAPAPVVTLESLQEQIANQRIALASLVRRTSQLQEAAAAWRNENRTRHAALQDVRASLRLLGGDRRATRLAAQQLSLEVQLLGARVAALGHHVASLQGGGAGAFPLPIERQLQSQMMELLPVPSRSSAGAAKNGRGSNSRRAVVPTSLWTKSGALTGSQLPDDAETPPEAATPAVGGRTVMELHGAHFESTHTAIREIKSVLAAAKERQKRRAGETLSSTAASAEPKSDDTPEAADAAAADRLRGAALASIDAASPFAHVLRALNGDAADSAFDTAQITRVIRLLLRAQRGDARRLRRARKTVDAAIRAEAAFASQLDAVPADSSGAVAPRTVTASAELQRSGILASKTFRRLVRRREATIALAMSLLRPLPAIAPKGEPANVTTIANEVFNLRFGTDQDFADVLRNAVSQPPPGPEAGVSADPHTPPNAAPTIADRLREALAAEAEANASAAASEKLAPPSPPVQPPPLPQQQRPQPASQAATPPPTPAPKPTAKAPLEASPSSTLRLTGAPLNATPDTITLLFRHRGAPGVVPPLGVVAEWTPAAAAAAAAVPGIGMSTAHSCSFKLMFASVEDATAFKATYDGAHSPGIRRGHGKRPFNLLGSEDAAGHESTTGSGARIRLRDDPEVMRLEAEGRRRQPSDARGAAGGEAITDALAGSTSAWVLPGFVLRLQFA